MEIGWIMFGFFIFVTMIFVVVALFLPEWIGITGKVAKEIQKEHVQEVSAAPLEAPKQDETSKPI